MVGQSSVAGSCTSALAAWTPNGVSVETGSAVGAEDGNEGGAGVVDVVGVGDAGSSGPKHVSHRVLPIVEPQTCGADGVVTATVISGSGWT